MNRPSPWFINGRYLTQPQTGVQRYAGEIVRAMDARLAGDEALARRLPCELIVPAGDAVVPALQAIGLRRSRAGRGQAWEQAVLPAMAAGGGLLNLANLGPLAHPNQIVCLHDANVYLEPASYARRFRLSYKALLPLLARRATAVTTVSAFSAASLAACGVTREPAAVLPNGHEHALRWVADASPFAAPDQLPRPFVFALGSRALHKRLDLLIGLAPALDALGLDLVLSGGASTIFAGSASAQATPPSAPRNVRTIGFVGDDDLAALFRRALCFAFPSRTEGFGLPLLEAMVHGAPIIASDRASMPEVCGDAALYASPDDPAAWLAQIRRLRDDPALRCELKARGTRRYPRFSWAASADGYLALAERLSSPARAAPRPAPAAARRTAL